MSAIAVGVAAPALAGGPRPLSQAWFAAHVDASTGQGAASSAASTLGRVTVATQNLALVASRVAAMEAAEGAAAQAATGAAALAASTVPNGLVMGGLQTAPGAAAGSMVWQGANLPTQTTSGGRDEVSVTQTGSRALLTWQTFNVGAKTDVSFDQSAGGASASNWVVLNRVDDPAAAPSQILGTISAPGKVYIINANGIVFGAGSEVNLGALIASTADITDSQFQNGIYGAQSGSSFAPTFTGAAADSAVVVDEGAQITTTAPASLTAAGGYVMLLGGNVENDGMIETPSGQTVLGAGEDFILRAGYSTTGNQTATVEGSQVASTGKTGAATNAGVIIATLGDVSLVGHDLTQAGAIVSTTSVNTRGTVHFLTAADDGGASVTLAPGSVTVVNPDNSATTALDSQRASLISQSQSDNLLRLQTASASNPQLNDVGTLPDFLDESRIEITTGGIVSFDSASLTMSQGGQIAVQSGARAWIGDGAMLDVSGSTGAVLPMSSNLLTVNIQGNELRDAPVNRDTGLISSNNVDLTIGDLVQVGASSADASVRDYTAGGLLEVSGYLSNLGHTIDEWAAAGGTISLDANQVIAQPAATLNVSGGSVSVTGGELAQSYLIGPGGQLFNVNTAPANIAYSGVYDGTAVQYARFGFTDYYASSLAAPSQIYQAGYSYGRDAGAVDVIAPIAVLEATIDAGVDNGARQTQARAAGVTDAYARSQNSIAEPGTLDIVGYNTSGTLFNNNVTITDDYTPIADGISATGTLPAGSFGVIALDGAQLNAEQLGGVSITAGGTIDVIGSLSLAAGGTLALAGDSIAIGGNLSARGGSIALGNLAVDPFSAAAAAAVLTPTDNQSGGVAVADNATIDLRGEWTNAAINATSVAGEGLENGGTLSIDAVRGLTIGQGTTIDTSGGGALLAGNKQAGGKGGSVTLIGDDPLYGAYGAILPAVAIGASFKDYGVDGGGTLSITVPSVLVAEDGSGVAGNTVLLDPATFQSGFADYVVDGFTGLNVAPGTAVSVAEPVYVFYGSSQPGDFPTGSDPASVFSLILPPTYTQDEANARLTQRKGASVAFIANDRPGQTDEGGGAIDLGAGSSISVDPGQSVRIEAFGQLTDDAAITARGGSVALINESQNYTGALATPVINANATLALSVFVGGDASIDVAGVAATGLDTVGRPYGVVTPGGSITIGGAGSQQSGGYVNATDAAVIIRPGAVLDASGAAATIDLLAGTTPALASQSSSATISTDPIVDASNGGTIALSSYSGVFIDGTLQAAGGAGAAGGLLAIALETSDYPVGPTIPDVLYQPRVLTVTQDSQPALDVAGFAAGDKLPVSLFGTAGISQQQITAGGFGSADLFARDAIAFDGDVTLTLPVALTLRQGVIADTSTSGAVTIASPYVAFIGETPLTNVTPSVNNAAWMPFANAVTGTLSVDADLIDVTDAVRFGIDNSYTTAVSQTQHTLRLPGFAQITLNSAGDIRFNTSSFTTEGDLTLQADQIYPTTGAVANVYAGYNAYSQLRNFWNTDGTLTVLGNGVDPAVPYSVGGSLNLYAGNIVQDGVVRAPEGNITLGAVDAGPSGLGSNIDLFNSYSYAVTLMPGSITSVSLEGATVPYGGTVDGVTYDYNGLAVGSFDPSVTIAGQTQTVQSGALIDLLGGGTLAGSGFVTGRGGSVNVLLSPFLVFNAAADSVTVPTLATAPVYALVPGYESGYAPTSPIETSGGYGSVPGLGAQITIGAGVPGIAAGTYTLLPSYYALLPGAARVQINIGAYDSTPGVTALGAGSYELNATTSVANTGVAQALPVEAIVTTNAGVQENSEFNIESYSAFELAQAAQFGTPRSSLPEDGKTLDLIFPAIAAAGTALQFGGVAAFGAASGGYAGQAELGGVTGSTLGIEVTADGVAPDKGFTAIEASALDAIGAPRLVIGGTLSRDQSLPTQLDFSGTANQVVIESGADLSAAEIFLTAGASGSRGSSAAGGITVDDGAVLSTLGKGAPAYDSTNGYYYNADGSTVIALSNGLLTFTPSTSQQVAFGPITIADGATLLTDGTLNFVTTQNLALGVNANYGAKYLSLDLNTINIVSDADLAAYDAGTLVLPSGLILTQDVISRLLGGDAATGAPALQSLTLSATGEVNFVGGVVLDATSLQDLVLDTPAIYGFGTASDAASISTQTLYWNGVENGAQGTAGAASALPGGVVAGGPGFGDGSLAISAQNIVLGYGPDTTPDDQTTLDRLIEGFASVALDAATSLSANAQGSLSVYQTPGAYGAAGTGGTLTIATPLITGAAGSVDSIVVGGALTLAPPTGVAASTTSVGALGASLNLTGGTIDDGAAILLNSGRLTMTATDGDVTLSGARVDLAGTATTLVNETEYSSGGSLVLSAQQGDVSADSASSIDVSAAGNVGGSIDVAAAQGTASLDNAFAGGGGTGLASATFTLDAQTIADFDALNVALDAGHVFEARSFELGSGDLTIDGSVTAKTIAIATDAGAITVAGTGVLDAAGAAPGSITLAAAGNLTVQDGALLDAHGSVLQADSTGAAIEAENRAQVSLTSQAGTLTLGDATIDVSSPDATPLGQVILDAPRVLDGGAETGNVAIAATGPIDIIGAQTIALYASRDYTPSDADGTIAQSDTGVAGEITLDQLNADNAGFIADATGNATLNAATAGLAAYAAYQLRPADVIVSSAASGGNLTVAGDLDLSSMRYGAGAGTAPGAGIAGLLSLRAADNLVVNGSITDGFATPEDASVHTADDKGWLLYANEPLGAAVTLPTELAKPVQLAGGTSFGVTSGGSLSFGITIGSATLNASVVYPTSVATAKTYTIGTGGLIATAAITLPDGTAYAAGQIVPAGTMLPAGTVFAQGTVLPFAVKIASGTFWPAGASLATFDSKISQTVTLKLPRNTYLALSGGETIPGGSSLVFSQGQSSVKLRATNANGVQGLIYATASLLPAGSQSWSINLVAGANLASGNVLAVNTASQLASQAAINTADPAGSIVLADTHYTLTDKSTPSDSFSVIRTGTGSLNLVAGGNVDEQSLFGVYTAGTQTSLGAAADAAYDPGRATTNGGTVLGRPYASYNDVVAAQQASYPDHGGDVLVSAGNDLIGDIVGAQTGNGQTAGSDAIGNWLWRQGGAGIGQSTSWWINFGSYVLPLTAGGGVSGAGPVLAGFTGIGALGGGNVTVAAGNNAGEVDDLNNQGDRLSQGLVIAVASTGRVTAVTDTGGIVSGGTTDVTGGGLLTLDVAGTLNPILQVGNDNLSGGGTLTDLRGDIDVSAGQIGRIDLVYGATNVSDPRPQDPFTTQDAAPANGIIVAPGDGTVTLDTMRDLVLAGAGDPTRQAEQALTAVDPSDLPKHASGFGGDTGFSLWTDATAIDLFSDGGNITPITAEADGTAGAVFNDSTNDYTFTYPATLEAVSASGSLYYGRSGTVSAPQLGYSLELAPAPAGELQLIAAQSIYANGYAVDMSGAAASAATIPNPYNPAYTDNPTAPDATGAIGNLANLETANDPGPNELFAFEDDTATTDLHAGDTQPALIYAATGDLVNVDFGQIFNFPLSAGLPFSVWYLAAKPADLYAGRDIVSNGVLPSAYNSGYAADTFTDTPNDEQGAGNILASGSLLMNLSSTDVSSVTAGRDILGSYFYVAGPGLLNVSAGRNINDTGAAVGTSALSFGVFKSLGTVIDANAANRSSGAGIAITDGAGSAGPDYTAFADLYFNDANQADLAVPLSDPSNAGKVQQTYEVSLYDWLQQNYGYTGDETGALAAFLALPDAVQGIFVRDVFYDELNASGSQYSDPSSLFYHSYARGKLAIATLFPGTDASGNAVSYDGGITMDSGTILVNQSSNGLALTFDAGVTTLNGGAIQILTPGGADTFGTAGGPAPGASSGVITEGDGDIDIYSLGSVLLGQSRIFTTFGGNILIWSAAGDINAGRGAKTTTLLPPPVIAYDAYGDITLSPATPSSGAGIATLAPIAGTAPGDVSLIAPLGSVDAGEAGIRVSGNLNIAAQTVVNAANVQVGGKTSGNTATVTTNAAAAAAAASSAGASADAAAKASEGTGQQPLAQTPSIITVEVLDAGTNAVDDLKKRKRGA